VGGSESDLPPRPKPARGAACISHLLLLLLLQVPFTDGRAFLLRNLKSRPLVVVRAFLAAVHDSIRQ
jgi:hypothetical protein